MELSYRTILAQELSRRKKTNPAYSLRAFARDLQIAAPQLSSVMSGQKGMSPNLAKKVAARLDLSNEELQVFVDSAMALHARTKSERAKAEAALKEYSDSQSFKTIQSSHTILSEWFYLSILQCFDLKTFEPSTQWIAKKIGVTAEEANEGLNLLAQAGLLEKAGKFFRPSQAFVRTENIPSRAIRGHIQQMMRIASQAIETQSIDERDFSSTVFPVDPARLPEFKKKLQSFREQFCKDAAKSKNLTAIYSLSMQFFRISKT